MNFDTKHLYAVVMAGGKGERFWPAGRQSCPKQMLSLTGDKTMIEETVLRLFPLVPPDHVLVITNLNLVEKIRKILPIPANNVFGEPVGRDTAPCAALAAALVRRRDPDAVMVLLPADHVIRPAKNFQQTILNAAAYAQEGFLVTIGITPASPETGYGYIHCGETVSDSFRKVLGFREKPDHQTALKFFQNGDYLWNSGIFIWRADVISAEFRKHCPDLSDKLERWTNGSDYTADFADCEKISIDYAIMEKAENVLVAVSQFYWNDIGCWSALKSILPLDENNNAVRGNVIAIDSRENVLISDDNTLLGVVDMDNVAVIKSGNGILVWPLADEQRVKNLVNLIRNEKQEYL